MNGFINPRPGLEEQSIIIFETESGGIGVLKSLLDSGLMKKYFYVKQGNGLNISNLQKLDTTINNKLFQIISPIISFTELG